MHVLSETSSEHPFWLWPNLLSLDAPLIAVLWFHLFAVTGRIPLPPSVTPVLGFAVWTIYVADRLFDGMRANPFLALSARHRFYRRYRAVLFPLLISGLLLTCWLCFDLDTLTLIFGASLLLVVSAYFAAVHWLHPRFHFRLPKEAVVATVFGVGTLCPAWIHGHVAPVASIVVLAFFVAICWLNIVLIEYAEWVTLRYSHSETPHATTVIAGKHAHVIALFVCVTALILANGTADASMEHWMLLAVSSSALALAILGFCWRKLSINATRVLADATLLTPLVVLLFLHP